MWAALKSMADTNNTNIPSFVTNWFPLYLSSEHCDTLT